MALTIELINTDYKDVAASTTAVLATVSGATGDTLIGLLAIPATTSPGSVTLTDGTLSAVTVFAGGTVTDVKPFAIPMGCKSSNGPWKIITSANIAIRAFGKFT